MIYYLVTYKHRYTTRKWIKHSAQLLDRMRILPYQRLRGWLKPGVFIFSDIERLNSDLRRSALTAWTNASKAGCTCLNHPSESLRRVDLQHALNNDFRVFRASEPSVDIRFPVFLRGENDHRGNLTELLYSSEELRSALIQLPDALIVEFIDTSDRNGIFRKYSCFRIGDRILPRHILFSRNWMVKQPDLVTEKFIAEELDYLRKNPHEAEVRRAFESAKIEYGRIDYGLSNDKLQIWEINSNPMLETAASAADPRRKNVHDLSAEFINAEFLSLIERPLPKTKRIWCGIRFDSLHRSRFEC